MLKTKFVPLLILLIYLLIICSVAFLIVQGKRNRIFNTILLLLCTLAGLTVWILHHANENTNVYFIESYSKVDGAEISEVYNYIDKIITHPKFGLNDKVSDENFNSMDKSGISTLDMNFINKSLYYISFTIITYDLGLSYEQLFEMNCDGKVFVSKKTLVQNGVFDSHIISHNNLMNFFEELENNNWYETVILSNIDNYSIRYAGIIADIDNSNTQDSAVVLRSTTDISAYHKFKLVNSFELINIYYTIFKVNHF